MEWHLAYSRWLEIAQMVLFEHAIDLMRYIL